MNKGLKKSLYFGLAAAAFAGAAGFASSNASAKTYASVTSNRTMTSEPGTRNVVTNGTNALYTKAGTLRGARLVASKSRLSTLGNSSSSQYYFRAYRVATTNRGSVYYKVVSFNQQYRGWIYGGKSTSQFAGGINSTDTMKSAALPSTTTGYTLKDINTNTLWQSPKWTQYKAQQSDMSGYKAGDTFKITDAATKSREGWLYYQVVDENNANVTGWVFADGLTQTTPTTVGTVNINYVTASGNSIKTSTWNIPSSDVKSGATVTNGATLGSVLNNTTGLTNATTANLPAGYAVDSATPAASSVTVGGTYTVKVKTATANQASSTLTYAYRNANGSSTPFAVSSLISSDQGKINGLNSSDLAAFTGNSTSAIAPSAFSTQSLFGSNGVLAKLTDVSGATYTYNPTQTAGLNAANNVKYGQPVTLLYDRTTN